MSVEHRLVIQILPDGVVRTLYDEVAALHELGATTVERVTDVVWDETWQWWIPLDVLTREPLTAHGYKSRVDAIMAEVEVLNGRLKEGTL